MGRTQTATYYRAIVSVQERTAGRFPKSVKLSDEFYADITEAEKVYGPNLIGLDESNSVSVSMSVPTRSCPG